MGRPHAVAPLHLVRVRARLARQYAGVGAEADHLVAQPAVVQLIEEPVRRRDELWRVDRRLGVDGRRELRRAEVGVDHPVDVPADPQPQAEVALDDGLAHAVSISSPRDGSRG
jgi:hypothetical protein